MSIWQAILLGLVQGLTEFIPISSTAHLTLAGKTIGVIDPQHPQQWTAFIAVIQLGTLLAVLIYFWSDIISIIRGFTLANIALIKKQPVEEIHRQQARLGWFVVIGTIPIATIGLALKDIIEGRLTKNLWVIAASLIGLALLLAIAEFVASQKRDMTSLRLLDALAVGLAQVFALIPGSSRSGTTITGGLLAGIKREAAARFSFLLSIPAIAASGLLEFREVIRSHDAQWTPIIIASIVAAISGYLSIAFLLRYLQKHTTYLFVIYRIALGVLLIALLMTGRIAAD
ncbi:MAG TPA: undecaprenyl-diphosphatase UppP [Blastocatellia bacterium]|jgi:undecaprenyl-diphosphatase